MALPHSRALSLSRAICMRERARWANRYIRYSTRTYVLPEEAFLYIPRATQQLEGRKGSARCWCAAAATRRLEWGATRGRAFRLGTVWRVIGFWRAGARQFRGSLSSGLCSNWFYSWGLSKIRVQSFHRGNCVTAIFRGMYGSEARALLQSTKIQTSVRRLLVFWINRCPVTRRRLRQMFGIVTSVIECAKNYVFAWYRYERYQMRTI